MILACHRNLCARILLNAINDARNYRKYRLEVRSWVKDKQSTFVLCCQVLDLDVDDFSRRLLKLL